MTIFNARFGSLTQLSDLVKNVRKHSVGTFSRASYILFAVDMAADSRSRPQSVTVAIAIRIYRYQAQFWWRKKLEDSLQQQNT
jgi:hypothetical protein